MMQRRNNQGTKIQARLENSSLEEASLRPGSAPNRMPFATIDDCLQLTKQLQERLIVLGQYRHPLAVRKGASLRKGVKGVFDNLKEHHPAMELAE